jgi:hypothetical protein
VIEDSKLPARRANGWNGLPAGTPCFVKLRRHGFARNEGAQLLVTHVAKPVQVGNLFFQIVVRSLEPIAPVGAAVNSKRPTNRAPEFSFSQLVVLGEDFDSLGQAGALYPHAQSKGQIIDVNPTLFGEREQVSKFESGSTWGRLR